MENHDEMEWEGVIPFPIHNDERLAGGRTMTACYIVGISGSCGTSCVVFKAGKCEHQDEIEQESEK